MEQKVELFLELLKKINRSETFKRFNLYSQGEICVLMDLLQRAEITTPGEIAHHTVTSMTRVAGILKTLEKKGYLVRAVNVKDRRKVLVILTDEGRKYAQAQKLETFQRLQLILDEMGKEQAEVILKALQTFYELGEKLSSKE